VTSPAQIAANRRNAQKSTGPRTANGKAASRLNALKHGLTAETCLLPGESLAEFEHLRARLVAEFTPATVIDEIQVERLAGLVWRLRRVGLFERELLVWINGRQAEAFDQSPQQQLLVWHDALSPQRHAAAKLGRPLEEFFDKDFAWKLGRYEAHWARQVRNVIHDLRSRIRDCN
jgi:hypothetical protein